METRFGVAGIRVQGFSGDGGLAMQAEFSTPEAVTVDALGNLCIADASNFRVRRIDEKTGIITTIVGSGTGGNGSPAVDAQIGKSFGRGWHEREA